MTEVQRYDIGKAVGVETTPEGFLMVDAYFARTGVQVYGDGEGKEHREYRPAAEVFNPRSLSSFRMKPVALGHPAEGLITADNAKRYQVGHIGENVAPERRFVRGKFLVTDGEAISAIRRGVRKLSVGYKAKLDETPGISDDGERYDAVQREIEVNHLAIVEKGRAGEDVGIKLDGTTAVMRFDADDFPREDEKVDKRLTIVKLDGIDYEAAPEVANALAKAWEATTEVTKKLEIASKTRTDELDTLRAQHDALKERLDEAEKRDIRAEVKARVALEKSASAICPDLNLDEMSDGQIRNAVILAKYPDLKLDEKSADALAERFQMALEKHAQQIADGIVRADALGKQREKAIPKADAAGGDVLEQAARKNADRIMNAWKQPARA